jgi:Ca-activated chloride channel family protein
VTRPAARAGAAVALVVALSSLTLAQDGRQGQAPPVFRTGINLVSMNVTVTEGTRYVTGLTAQDFQVFEDGVQQDISYFAQTNLPIALSLLLDTSASMESRLQTAQEAAIGFARQLKTQDVAEIVDFDNRVDILQTFTNDKTLLEQAIRRTSAAGSTAVFNALYYAFKNLQKLPSSADGQLRRQAIVLLSDGLDTGSMLTFDEVLEVARRSDAAVYAIGLGGSDERGSNNRTFNEAEFNLRQLTRDTGGRAFFPDSITDLAGVYGQIADELSSQYTMGYTPRNTRADGTYRRIVVRVNRPDTTARTRQGYFAPGR